MRALEVQNLTLLSKQIKGTQFLQHHDGVVDRKRSLKEKHELGTLTNYVMAGKKLNENLVSLQILCPYVCRTKSTQPQLGHENNSKRSMKRVEN